MDKGYDELFTIQQACVLEHVPFKTHVLRDFGI